MLLRFMGVYLFLWFVTAWVGAPMLGRQQRRVFIQGVLDRRQRTLESIREHGEDPEALQYLEVLYANEIYDGREGQMPRLQMRTTCFAPFIVRVDQDKTGGFLVGKGWATTYF